MFSDQELEGCPSVQFEEWANTHEADIRACARVFDGKTQRPEHYGDSDKLEHIMELLMMCWSDKKCPYA